MRNTRIFLLYLERVFQYRSQIFVWFLISFIHPIIYLLFWTASGNTSASIVFYYLLFMIAGGLLYVHVEADAYEDIGHGNLGTYLVKPYSYISFKFMSELPWRLIQGGFGILTLAILYVIEPALFSGIRIQPDVLLLAMILVITGYSIMFLFKMIVLISAFWFTDIGAFQQIIDVLIVILGGFIMPIQFFPLWAQNIAYFTPFPYAIYYPVATLSGMVTISDGIRVLAISCIWIGVLHVTYRVLWNFGVKRFSGVGQ